MSMRVINLNLLQDSERLSSSPVRLKIILPIATGVLLVGSLLWWAFLWLQDGLVRSELATLQGEKIEMDRPYVEVCRLKDVLRDKEAELNQFKGYLAARRTWGETLAAVAQAVPDGVQLRLLEIPEPPVQNLNPPPGVKRPPLLGPTNEVEAVSFRLAGRTSREAYVFDFLDAVKSTPIFTNNLIIAQNPGASKEPSPKMRQFGQDKTTDEDGHRAIVFDIEYRTPGRRFAP